MRIVPAASIAASFLVFTLPVLATTQTGPFVVNVTTSPNPYAIEGTTSVKTSAGILAKSTGTGDSALEGYAEGQDSAGLEGFAQSSSGTPSNGVYGYAANGYGVYGLAASAAGSGVVGLNLSTSGGTGVTGTAAGLGVYGVTTGGSAASENYGVFGLDQTTNHNHTGVYGQSSSGYGIDGNSNSGIGVAGGSGTGMGVFGFSTSSNGAVGTTSDTTNSSSLLQGATGNSSGVLGEDDSDSSSVAGNAGVTGTSQYGFGVVGESQSAFGVYATSTTGTAVGGVSGVEGVEGETTDNAAAGHLAGVVGRDDSQSASVTNDIGVEGISEYGQGVYGGSDEHQGVYGTSIDNTGVAAISNKGNGLIAESSGSSAAVGIFAYKGGDVIDATGLPAGASSTESVMSLDGSGNMILLGGLTEFGTPKSAVRDTSGTERITYSQRATQATIEDFGRAEMTGGRAVVRLDPTFASTLADGDYLVFLTAGGRSNGLYVANRSLTGFEIRENEGASTLEIDYRIVGRPRTERLEPRLAPIAVQRDSPATQQLARAADDIARIGASHRAADKTLRIHLALVERAMRALPKRFKAPPKPLALPHIRIVGPHEYGPHLPY